MTNRLKICFKNEKKKLHFFSKITCRGTRQQTSCKNKDGRHFKKNPRLLNNLSIFVILLRNTTFFMDQQTDLKIIMTRNGIRLCNPVFFFSNKPNFFIIDRGQGQ